MMEFDKIYLSWRKGQGSRRHIVGKLQQTQNGLYMFSYDKEEVKKAQSDGFKAYTEFPEIEKTYNGNVLDIFAQRLMKQGRPDIQTFYDFWEIEPGRTDDKFYLLGHTQGLQPTDNFEFLADFNPVPGLHFLTELAGLSAYEPPPGALKSGDALRFEREANNEFDPEAIAVFKDNTRLGYIKKIHCRVFHKFGADKLRLSVKAIDKNGKIKKVFIKVAYVQK